MGRVSLPKVNECLYNEIVLIYPNVILPDYFTRLLRANIQNVPAAYNELGMYIGSNDGFWALCQKYFRTVDEKGRLETIIKALGWEGFRDRMASIFIYRYTNDAWPESIPEECCYEILQFEGKLTQYKTENNSRAFLLGLYLEMACRWISKNTSANGYVVPEITDELIGLLKYSKTRIIKIDWILILLFQFKTFLGMDELKGILKSEDDYSTIYNRLSVKEREIFTKNLLAYGSSINESDFFVGEVV